MAVALTSDHVVLRDPVPALDPVYGDLLVGLFDQGPDPHAQVGGHHVRQAEAGQELEAVDVQPCVHEDKVHLAEGEDRLQDGVDAPQDLVAGGVPGNLEEAAKLHAVVDHRPKTET